MNDPPLLSVIVPFHNASPTLASCLDALLAAPAPPLQVIAVDDGSEDDSPALCRERNVRLITMETRGGPAAARNRGAEGAQGDLLFFLDADVIIEPDNPEKLLRIFQDDPDVAAVFGSYDTDPGAPNFLSQYRNLLHHYIHQKANPEALTFWAGCGAVRREVFLQVGGFDARRYPRPSIEDIELGLRLSARGHRIRLDKTLQVKHLKEWRFLPMLRTDICSRAWPWARLMLERGDEVRDLNLGNTERWSGALVCLILLSLGAVPFAPESLSPLLAVSSVGMGSLVLGLNWSLYRFFARVRGPLFAARVIPLHVLYFLYGSLTFGCAWLRVRLFGTPHA